MYGNQIPETSFISEICYKAFDDACTARANGQRAYGRTPPDGMFNMALTATRIKVSINGKGPITVAPWFILFQGWPITTRLRILHESDTTNIVDANDHIRPDDPENNNAVKINGQDLANYLGDRLKHIGLEYDPDQHCFRAQIDLPLDFPETRPAWFIYHGTGDLNCPIESTITCVNFLQGIGCRVELWEVQGMQHAFDFNSDTREFQERANRIRNAMGWDKQITM